MKTAQFAKLYTQAGEALARAGWDAIPWQAYPRPRLERDSYLCLNGVWQFSANGEPEEKILVPFPPESLLSGIGRDMGPRPHLCYTRSFTLPDGFLRDRVILHFGAVDQIARVSLNGHSIGEHRGGYIPFSFDITDHLMLENTLTVEVTDDTASFTLPYGKQSAKRGGMWYTPVSGIWQTVWLESVPAEYVRSLHVDTGAAGATIRAEGVSTGEVTVNTPDGAITVPLFDGMARVALPSPRLWSPEDPYLYTFTLRAGQDCVHSYFAMRTLSIETVEGLPRLCLNGRPYFFHGLLDQGYFSDGIFLPASPEGYTEDILAARALGFNTLRKHIKIEPQRFYYDCDRLGMVVFQDMINNGKYAFLRDTALPTVGLKRRNDRRLHRDPDTRAAFLSGMEETVELLRDHPSVCYWTIFNEGWGQFDSTSAYRRLRELDASRFIDTASGWFTPAESDVESLHVYFKPFKMPKKISRPVVLSEFGGYACSLAGHVFNPDHIYGYRVFSSREALETEVRELYAREIFPAIPRGLCAAIYTQLSDVEDETNGLLTYDRKVTKIGAVRP